MSSPIASTGRAEAHAADAAAKIDVARANHALEDSAPGASSLPVAQAAAPTVTSAPPAPRRKGSAWRLVAGGSALLLTLLTAAAAYLITKKPSTIDQLVILTVPSGAEIKLNSRDYGHSPVKLERLPIGSYMLEITKEGYEPIAEQVNIVDGLPVERRLKLLPPSDSAGLTPDEEIRQYEQRATDAFEQRHYAIPFEYSALYYSDLIIDRLDQSNSFALEMKERIRKALHQAAQAAVARGDLGQAQEIFSTLVERYPTDAEARQQQYKVDSQLAAHAGEVRDLVRKAEEALRAGNLIEPFRTSAFYYARQVLAIDKQNAQARAVRSQVKEMLTAGIKQLTDRGETDAAMKRLEEVTQLFPEDHALVVQLHDLTAHRAAEAARASDPRLRRERGLSKYSAGQFSDAIPDLEFAISNSNGSSEVVFALARSHMMLNHLDQAASYFNQVPASREEQYVSARACLGDIAMLRNDTARALERYKEARQLGGSTLYSLPTLDAKIEQIEKRQREKAEAPTPVAIQVRHQHGSLRGSCGGTLILSPTGVRYDGADHTFAANLVHLSVGLMKDELTIQFGASSQKFKGAPADLERFREALGRYQQYYAPANK